MNCSFTSIIWLLFSLHQTHEKLVFRLRIINVWWMKASFTHLCGMWFIYENDKPCIRLYYLITIHMNINGDRIYLCVLISTNRFMNFRSTVDIKMVVSLKLFAFQICKDKSDHDFQFWRIKARSEPAEIKVWLESEINNNYNWSISLLCFSFTLHCICDWLVGWVSLNEFPFEIELITSQTIF